MNRDGGDESDDDDSDSDKISQTEVVPVNIYHQPDTEEEDGDENLAGSREELSDNPASGEELTVNPTGCNIDLSGSREELSENPTRSGV